MIKFSFSKDEPRSGRPKIVTIPEIIVLVQNIVNEDPNLTKVEQCSDERVLHILFEEIPMKELFGKLVSHSLTIQQKFPMQMQIS